MKITHLVLWKYRQEIDQKDKADHVARLRSIARVVPGIEMFDVGFDILHLSRSYDTGLVAVFTDRSALDAYMAHPDHVVVADFGRGLSQHVVSVDFESTEL